MLKQKIIVLQEVQEEVRKVNKMDNKKSGNDKPGQQQAKSSSGVVIVTGVAKKQVEKGKGELIEQNQDGLEVFDNCIIDLYTR